VNMLQFAGVALAAAVVFRVALALWSAARRSAAGRAHQMRWKQEPGVDVTGGDGVWMDDTDEHIFHRWGEGDLDREYRQARERAAEDERLDEPDWRAWTTPDSWDSGSNDSSDW
jgi:hypothetical protein